MKRRIFMLNTRKKRIVLVFNRRVSSTLFNNLSRDLKLVFQDDIEVSKIDLQALKEDEIIDADAILLMRHSAVEILKNYVRDPQKLIIVTRTITEEMIFRIYDIPKGSRVLVVNDMPETTADTIVMLHRLGINHLDLIPYEPGLTDLSEINAVITPGEAQRVPEGLSNIVDIGDRRLDIMTMLDVMTVLNLGTDRHKQALIRYSDTTLEMHTGIKDRYKDSYILNEVMKQILDLQSTGLLVTDAEYQINYYNVEMERIIRKSMKSNSSMTNYFSPKILSAIMSSSFNDDLLVIEGKQFVVTKTILSAMDKTSGYFFSFEAAAQIRKSSSNLSHKLKNQGLTARYTFNDIIYRNPDMEHLVSLAKKAAPSDYTILITGETGTGKEMFAQAIHNASNRKNGPFVAVNCAALPESLLESELFGYEEGAFTGAKRGGKIGLFEQADGGTIFLDEIGDMSYSLQSRLLRVLQEHQVVRVGGNSVINIDVRVLTATNANLKQMIQDRQFREDLFFRLNVFPLQLIPLRKRSEDILPMFCTFAGVHPDSVSDRIRSKLLTHNWPGNIRELRNAAEYYLLMGTLECLPDADNSDISSMTASCKPVPSNKTPVSDETLYELIPSIISRRNQCGQTTGRQSLIRELRASGIFVSENRLEQALKYLVDSKAIIRNRGRGGLSVISV